MFVIISNLIEGGNTEVYFLNEVLLNFILNNWISDTFSDDGS